MGNFLLALAYMKSDVWEMARVYFEMSGENGNTHGFFNAARMEILMNRQDSAARHLAQLRGAYPTLQKDISQELSLLLRAYGQEIYAQTEWAKDSLDINQRMRISLYADSTEGYLWALENFRDMLAKDSSNLYPYIEMGNLYKKYKDTLDLSTYKLGLRLDSQNPHLLIGIAKSFLNRNQLDSAIHYLQRIADTSQVQTEFMQTHASWYLLQKDTLSALTLLHQAYDLSPLKTDIALELVMIYLDQSKWFEAHEILLQALDYNDQNPYLWLYYARVMDEWENIEARDHAREILEELSPGGLIE